MQRIFFKFLMLAIVAGAVTLVVNSWISSPQQVPASETATSQEVNAPADLPQAVVRSTLKTPVRESARPEIVSPAPSETPKNESEIAGDENPKSVKSSRPEGTQATSSANALLAEILDPGFRKLPADKQMATKERLARYLSAGDAPIAQVLAAKVDELSSASPLGSDLFEVLAMGTGFSAAKAVIDLALGAKNEEVRKSAIPLVSRIYKTRGYKRQVSDAAKIEGALISALARNDLSDREFGAIIQGILGFGSEAGVQTVLSYWDATTPTRQEMITARIPTVFQQTALPPLVACLKMTKQLWKPCGMALAMIGAPEGMRAMIEQGLESQEKRDESINWIRSVSRVAALKTLAIEAKANMERDPQYCGQIVQEAEAMLSSLKPERIQ